MKGSYWRGHRKCTEFAKVIEGRLGYAGVGVLGVASGVAVVKSSRWGQEKGGYGRWKGLRLVCSFESCCAFDEGGGA